MSSSAITSSKFQIFGMIIMLLFTGAGPYNDLTDRLGSTKKK